MSPSKTTKSQVATVVNPETSESLKLALRVFLDCTKASKCKKRDRLVRRLTCLAAGSPRAIFAARHWSHALLRWSKLPELGTSGRKLARDAWAEIDMQTMVAVHEIREAIRAGVI